MAEAKERDGNKSGAVDGMAEVKKAELCCSKNCSEKECVWLFPKAARETQQAKGFYTSYNVTEVKNRAERRGQILVNMARKSLYGQTQQASVAFEECNNMPGYNKIMVKLDFFGRDFLYQFIFAGRMILGKEAIVADIKESQH